MLYLLINGAGIFLTVVDDYSRATWTFLVPTKQQTFQILSDFLSYVSTQFDKQIKKTRNDNGTLFLNKDVIPFLSKKGVLHQSSYVLHYKIIELRGSIGIF